MPLPTTATFVYTANTGQAVAADVETVMGAVPLYTNALTDAVINGLYQCTIASDTPGLIGTVASRTIVVNLTAGFFALFPTAAAYLKAFAADLYAHTLQQGIQAQVASAPIVFA